MPIAYDDVLLEARALLTRLHPRGRRWRRFLAEQSLDPDALEQPLQSPGAGDFMICGAPRTGTTLLAAMLFQPPHVITVVEPWAGMRQPPAQLFASLRRHVATTGVLPAGRLDVLSLIRTGEVRRIAEGSSVSVELGDEFLLGVKWPAFWRYLELLPDTKFIVCLRHPYEVISSFKAQGGRLGLGLEFDLPFHRRMNEELRRATVHPAVRRVLLYDYIHSRIIPFLQRPNVLVVRYERWFTNADALRRELRAFLNVDLQAGPAALRRSAGKGRLDGAERRIIDDHCRSAAALGYRCGDAVASNNSMPAGAGQP
jgi:hypothetical protein